MAKQKKESSNALVWVVLALIVAVSLWYYIQAPVPPASVENISSGLPSAATGIDKGDLVAMDFRLEMLNGTVVETNNESLAKEYHLKNYATGPYRFIVGQSGLLKGFDDALTGMTLGENATKVIPPSEPVLELVVNTTRRVVRNQPYPRFHQLSPAKFERAFGKKPVANMVVSNESLPWPFRVENVTNETVIIEADVVEGKTYHLPGYEWNSTVIIKAGSSVLVRHNPVDLQTMQTEFGPAIVHVGDAILNITYQVRQGDVINYRVPVQEAARMHVEDAATTPYQFKVLKADDKQFTIRRINYPAQETLELTAHILEWTPDVKDVKAPLKFKQS